MPYEIRPVSKGYKVFKEGTNESFSKKPLSLATAKKQQKALYVHMRGGGAPNPFYHLRGGDLPQQAWGMDEEEEVAPPPPEQPNLYPQSEEEYKRLTEPQPYDPSNPAMFMGSGFIDDMKDKYEKYMIGLVAPHLQKALGYKGGRSPFYHMQNAVVGGVAHRPKGHTTRNNNLTKQMPKQPKFCGFIAKKFEHEDYDPAKLHKFRAATCGGKPLPKGGRPAGAQNKQGYAQSGEFTAARKQYGKSRKFRGGSKIGAQYVPEEDELVSKKENPIVEKIIEEPMDDGDIRAYFPKAKVLRYADLADYDSIEELLPNDKSYAFLLYQHRPNDGHFTCVMRYAKTIEFFCSYGSKIDGPLKWTSLPEREALGEGKPWLSMLLKKAPEFKAIHNPVDFQSKKDGTATCGAYCVVRVNQLVNHNQDLHEFIDYMEELKKDTGLSYDEIVANYVQKR